MPLACRMWTSEVTSLLPGGLERMNLRNLSTVNLKLGKNLLMRVSRMVELRPNTRDRERRSTSSWLILKLT